MVSDTLRMLNMESRAHVLTGSVDKKCGWFRQQLLNALDVLFCLWR